MAAALFESLLLNHRFVDGNERVAFFATDVFLRSSGWRMRVQAQTTHSSLMKLFDAREADYRHLLPRIPESIVRL